MFRILCIGPDGSNSCSAVGCIPSLAALRNLRFEVLRIQLVNADPRPGQHFGEKKNSKIYGGATLCSSSCDALLLKQRTAPPCEDAGTCCYLSVYALAGIELNKPSPYLKQKIANIKKHTNKNTLKIVRLNETA